MEIKLAEYQDLGDILKLQRLAYKSEGQIYDDFRIPPLLQTEEEIKTNSDDNIYLLIHDVSFSHVNLPILDGESTFYANDIERLTGQPAQTLEASCYKHRPAFV